MTFWSANPVDSPDSELLPHIWRGSSEYDDIIRANMMIVQLFSVKLAVWTDGLPMAR
jgi:hypothetical protein